MIIIILLSKQREYNKRSLIYKCRLFFGKKNKKPRIWTQKKYREDKERIQTDELELVEKMLNK